MPPIEDARPAGLIGPPSPEIVSMLARVIADAKRGSLASLAMVIVTPQGTFGIEIGGQQMLQLHFGCALIQKNIMDRMVAVPAATGPSEPVKRGAVLE